MKNRIEDRLRHMNLSVASEAADEIERLRELLNRCETHLLIPEEATQAIEGDFWKLIEEIEKELGDE